MRKQCGPELALVCVSECSGLAALCVGSQPIRARGGDECGCASSAGLNLRLCVFLSAQGLLRCVLDHNRFVQEAAMSVDAQAVRA